MRMETGKLNILSDHNCSHTRQDQNKTVSSRGPGALQWRSIGSQPWWWWGVGGKLSKGSPSLLSLSPQFPQLLLSDAERRTTERYTDDSFGNNTSRGLYWTLAPKLLSVSSGLEFRDWLERVRAQEKHQGTALSKRAGAETLAGLCPKGPSGLVSQPPGAVAGPGRTVGEGAGAPRAGDRAGRRQRRGRRGGQAQPSSWAAQLTSAPGLRSQSGQDPSQFRRGDPHTLQPLRHLRGGCYSCGDSTTAARSQETTTDGRRALTHSHPFPRPLLPALPKRRWPHWEQKHSARSTRPLPERAIWWRRRHVRVRRGVTLGRYAEAWRWRCSAQEVR